MRTRCALEEGGGRALRSAGAVGEGVPKAIESPRRALESI